MGSAMVVESEAGTRRFPTGEPRRNTNTGECLGTGGRSEKAAVNEIGRWKVRVWKVAPQDSGFQPISAMRWWPERTVGTGLNSFKPENRLSR